MLEELPGSFGPVSEAEVEQVIAQMDQDGDGVVTEADFNGYVDTTAPEDDVLQHVEAKAAEEACRRAGSRPRGHRRTGALVAPPSSGDDKGGSPRGTGRRWRPPTQSHAEQSDDDVGSLHDGKRRVGKWPTGTTMAEKRRDMFAAVDQVRRRADIVVSILVGTCHV